LDSFKCFLFALQNEGTTVTDFVIYQDPYEFSNDQILTAYYALQERDPNEDLPPGIAHSNCG